MTLKIQFSWLLFKSSGVIPTSGKHGRLCTGYKPPRDQLPGSANIKGPAEQRKAGTWLFLGVFLRMLGVAYCHCSLDL